MPVEKLTNNFTTTVGVGGIDASATSLPVVTAAPAALQGGQFRILIGTEILLVTATGAAGASPWTVTRGAEGTTASVHLAAAVVSHVLSAASLDAAIHAVSDLVESEALLLPWPGTGAAIKLGLEIGPISGIFYVSQIAHTAGASFAADLTAGRWAARVTGSTPTITAAGNLGAARSLALSATQEQWVVGTLTANLVLTVTALPDGGKAVLKFTQGTGPWTLTLTDGTSSSVVAGLPPAAGAYFEVTVTSTGGDVLYSGPGLQGLQGFNGPVGPQGIPGPQGNPGASGVDASTTVKGVVTLATAPVVAASPIVVGDNDGRLVIATATVVGRVKIVGTPTDSANPTVRVKESGDKAFAPQIPGLVFPVGLGTPIPSGVGALQATRMYFARCVIPFDGTLHDVALFISVTSGNIIASVYDVAATTRTRLWDSGSVAVGTAGAYQIIGDPALAVTQGQQIDIAIMIDNATASVARSAAGAAAMTILPTNFVPGSKPALFGLANPGSFATPATIAESGIFSINVSPTPIARVA